MKLRYTKTALRQIDEAIGYIDARSPQAADRFRKRILAVIDLIQRHPEAAQATDRMGLRRVVLTPYPYVAFYRLTPLGIVVSRVRHAARDPSESSN